MKKLFKKDVITENQKQINALKEDLRSCQRQMKRARALFEMATDENLIEAKIYEMKSLAKHHDYIVCSIKSLMETEKESRAVNA